MTDNNFACPDGIADRHQEPGRAFANPGTLILLTMLMIVALLGWLGGRPNPVEVAETDAVKLTVKTPTILRNGLFFETQIRIEPKRPVADLVLGLSPELWRDVTINSAIPAAEKEEFADGLFRFSFGKAEAGKPVQIKFAGQINPPLTIGNKGEIVVFDGDRRIAAMPVEMRLLP